MKAFVKQLIKENVAIYFTVVCSVTWPMNANKARVDIVLIQTSLLLSFQCKLFSCTCGFRTTWFTQQRQWGLYQNKVISSQGQITWADNCRMSRWRKHDLIWLPTEVDVVFFTLYGPLSLANFPKFQTSWRFFFSTFQSLMSVLPGTTLLSHFY